MIYLQKINVEHDIFHYLLLIKIFRCYQKTNKEYSKSLIFYEFNCYL